MTKKQIYLLLDSKSAPLARGVLETAPDGSVLQIHILDGKEDEVAQHEVIQLVGMESGGLAVQCQLLRQRGERISLNKVASLGSEFRRNLRVPVKFQSFIYPLSGMWKGRGEVQSVDISCGGIAFLWTVWTGEWRDAGDCDSNHGKADGAALPDSPSADAAEQSGVLRGEVCGYVQR